MWQVIQRLRKLKSLPKNKADQLEWLQELISELESADEHSHDECYSGDQVEEFSSDARSEIRQELEPRIEQLEEMLNKKGIPFPKKYRSEEEKLKFKIIPGGL